MESFKQIAEDCLAGKLSGTFILQDGSEVKSNYLRKLPPATSSICSYGLYEWYISDNGNAYGDTGYVYRSSIKRFIPDNMQEQIKIDIPEGKIPVMEQTESGVVITWKEKELTYDDVVIEQAKAKTHITIFSYNMLATNPEIHSFYKKVEVLRKLINIRNYFGKPKHFCDGVVIKCVNSYCGVETGQFYFDKPDLDNLHEVVFAKQEHAEQAIKMLGDELKYLFEPW